MYKREEKKQPWWKDVKVPPKTPKTFVPGMMKKEDFEKLFTEAVELYKSGVDGDAAAAAKACEILKKLHTMDYKNVLVEAYLGAATSLLGRDLINPIERFRTAMKGVKMLDHAVLQAPDNIEVRNLRAQVCLRLPENYFHRNIAAVDDFQYMISRYEKDPTVFSQETYWRTLYNLGLAYKNIERTKECKDTFDKLLSVTTDPKYANLAREALGEQPEEPADATHVAGEVENVQKEETEAGENPKKKLHGSFSAAHQSSYR